jgi:hypothetical protein
MLAWPAIQAKLTINRPGDQFEQEADRVADEVMRMPRTSQRPLSSSASESKLHRKCAECEEEEKNQLQRQEAGAGPAVAPPIVNEVLSSPGQPLDRGTRAFMEPRFGHDFSQARVHPAPFSDGDSGLAVQRVSNPTAVSIDGEELPELSAAPSQDGESDGPDFQVEQLEAGAPFAEAADGAQGGLSGTPQQPEEEDGTVQTSPNSGQAVSASISPKAVLSQLGGGAPMAHVLRTDMENALGHDFSRVRVHSDASAGLAAQSLGAHAFTLGEHVAFAPGLYQPGTAATRRLMTHELTHVVQQRRGLSGSILRHGIGEPGDIYEQEAEQTADRVAARPEAPIKQSMAPAGAPAEIGAVQMFSRSNAVSYAKLWAKATNPLYGRFPDNDCTSFVSQAMQAGGWSFLWGSDVCDDRKKDSVWWFKADGCTRWWRSNVNASHTWGGAENFRQFVNSSGRGTPAANVYDLEPGDVLQRDHGDGTIHHSMVVTGKGTDTVGGTNIVQLLVSYHTNDTLDRKFWGPGGFHETTTSGWNYFAWKIK